MPSSVAARRRSAGSPSALVLRVARSSWRPRVVSARLEHRQPCLTGWQPVPSPPASLREPASASSAPFCSAVAPDSASPSPPEIAAAPARACASPARSLPASGRAPEPPDCSCPAPAAALPSPVRSCLAPARPGRGRLASRPRSRLPPLSSLLESSGLRAAPSGRARSPKAPGPTTDVDARVMRQVALVVRRSRSSAGAVIGRVLARRRRCCTGSPSRLPSPRRPARSPGGRARRPGACVTSGGPVFRPWPGAPARPAQPCASPPSGHRPSGSPSGRRPTSQSQPRARTRGAGNAPASMRAAEQRQHRGQHDHGRAGGQQRAQQHADARATSGSSSARSRWPAGSADAERGAGEEHGPPGRGHGRGGRRRGLRPVPRAAARGSGRG